LLHKVNDIAVHVVRVEAVDAHRDGLAQPRQSMSLRAAMMFLRACTLSAGATAASKSRTT
jgi:hypothetical protein